MYDFKENTEIIFAGEQEKAKSRTCKIDSYQNLGGSFCQSFSFINFCLRKLPIGANISVLTTPGLRPYFYYYLVPEYNLSKKVEEADYLLYNIDSSDYYFDEGQLYQKSKDKSKEDKLIGNYRLFDLFSKRQVIMQKVL